MVNTFDDRRADSVIVKITNFGFAQRWSSQAEETQSGELPQRDQSLQILKRKRDNLRGDFADSYFKICHIDKQSHVYVACRCSNVASRGPPNNSYCLAGMAVSVICFHSWVYLVKSATRVTFKIFPVTLK